MTAAIALDNITLRYGGNLVLDQLSLHIEPGEIVALLGRSGCGKSSLLRSILGFATPEAGTVSLAGVTASQDGRLVIPPELRGVAVVFQDLALWPHMTVAENLAFGLDSRGVARKERATRIQRMLEDVGLAHQAGNFPGDLSGGERQRVAIARALVLQPHAVLLDEPLSNLDIVLKRSLLGVFRSLLEARGTAALFITHDLREAASIAHRIAVIEHGSIVQIGRLAELSNQPATEFVGELLKDLHPIATT